MINLKNNKGITMLTLVITVFVLVIIAGTAIYTGRDVLNDAKKEAVIQELQIIQNAVNNEHSKIGLASLDDENEDGAIDYIYNITWEKGQDIPNNLPSELQNIIGEGNGYRYFDKNDLVELGINGVNQAVLINFTTRDVFSINEIDGKYKVSDIIGTTNYNSNVVLEIDQVPIPNGFVYLTGSKDEGLTIKNIKDGNEFVWVPVETFSDFAVLQDGSTTNYRGQLWATTTSNNFGTKNEDYNANSGLREPAIVTGNDTGTGSSYDGNETIRTAILDEGYENSNAGLLQQFQDEFNDMAESVKTYGGFYVGRYETSWTGSKVASVATTNISQIFTAATDLGTSWTDIYTSTSNVYEATWYGLYAKQKKLYEKNSDSSVVSGMIYGCEWDAIMNWMLSSKDETVSSFVTNSTNMGNYSSKANTGSNINYRKNNIFDLAGNYNDFTQEAYSYSGWRITRGDRNTNAYYGKSPAIRLLGASTTVSEDASSRLQLYIKID